METFFFLRVARPVETFTDSTFVAMVGSPFEPGELMQKRRRGTYDASPATYQMELLKGGDVFIHDLLGFCVSFLEGSRRIRYISGEVGIDHRTKLNPQGGFKGRHWRQHHYRIGGFKNARNRGGRSGELWVFSGARAGWHLASFRPFRGIVGEPFNPHGSRRLLGGIIGGQGELVGTTPRSGLVTDDRQRCKADEVQLRKIRNPP